MGKPLIVNKNVATFKECNFLTLILSNAIEYWTLDLFNFGLFWKARYHFFLVLGFVMQYRHSQTIPLRQRIIIEMINKVATETITVSMQ